MRLLPDDALAAMNAWIEARGEPFEGQIAVCEVMRNRLKTGRWGKTVLEVILAPFQFSGWNTKDPNRTKALSLDDQDQEYQRALKAWKFSEKSDLTKGALYYYNPKVVTTPPAWADPKKLTAAYGNHQFYTE